MIVLPIAEAKMKLISLLDEVTTGKEVALSFGSEKKAVAVIVPFSKWKKSKERKLGTLKNRGEVMFSDDFEMSDEELVNL
ncbi:MAG: type II toxin-antitoxin system Phd/YefM family antitoxin [Marinilabiliaceae bacterium]|nr:type II toxin-antitoxin system Phd/YefM family antitoxin [Marinilabiliaceae bacterium]